MVSKQTKAQLLETLKAANKASATLQTEIKALEDNRVKVNSELYNVKKERDKAIESRDWHEKQHNELLAKGKIADDIMRAKITAAFIMGLPNDDIGFMTNDTILENTATVKEAELYLLLLNIYRDFN